MVIYEVNIQSAPTLGEYNQQEKYIGTTLDTLPILG